MKEVYPGIYLLKEKGSFGVFKPPENVYIFPGKHGLIFDAGYGTKKAINYIIEQIEKLKSKYGRDAENFKFRVLPSHAHPDHISGIALLREKIAAKIVLTKKMAEIIQNKQKYYKYYESEDIFEDLIIPKSFWKKIRFKIRHKLTKLFYRNIYGLSFLDDPEIIIEENSFISINGERWQVLSSPGHCLTHISLYNEEKGILLAGDNVLRTITTWLGPPSSNLTDYVQTIKHYKNLPNLKLILPSHGSPIKDPYLRLKEILAHRKNRSKQVLTLIQKSEGKGITVEQIIQELYSNESRMKQNVARGWICLTLELLEEQGKIEKKMQDKKILFMGNKISENIE
jgi:glyoxylase-like metal-dependent hydrolase (beta-lactamase superfamily II)